MEINITHSIDANLLSGLNLENLTQLTKTERQTLEHALLNFQQRPDAKDIKIPKEIYDKIKIKTPGVREPPSVEKANRIIWNIFGKCRPVEGNEKIVITGQVLGDGQGDWVAMTNQMKTLQKFFPDREVCIIACSNKKWKDKLDTSKIKQESLDLIFYEEAQFSGLSNIPIKAFPLGEKIQEKLEKAGVVIEAGVSLVGGMLSDEVLDQIKEKGIKIYEHDYKSSGTKIFAENQLETGLKNSHAGIFLASKKEYTWDDIENTNLKSVLFNNTAPSDDEIKSYSSNKECFFNYMSDLNNRIEFIGDVIEFSKTNSSEKSIDICLPNIISNKKNFVEIAKNIATSLEKLGPPINDFSKVTVIFWIQGHGKHEHILKDGIGKELRLIDPGGLSAKDFKRMISISAPLVGCTGDNSLAQTLSFGKIPCYEPRFKDKISALSERISNVCGQDSDLYKYVQKVNISHTEAALPNLVAEAKKFGEIIREESSFKPIFKGVVNETLLRQKDKDFARREDEMRKNYLGSIITSDEFQNQLTALLKEKGLLPEK